MVATVLTGAGNVTGYVKNTGGNSATAPIPANTVVGDVLIAIFISDQSYVSTTETPGWTKISVVRTGSLREVGIFHAFTKDGIPDAPVIVQTPASTSRASMSIFRVTGAHQTDRSVGTSAWSPDADTANTLGVGIPSTGATVPGVTFVAAYNNMNAAQDQATSFPTVNGATPAVYQKAYGTGTPGSASSTAGIIGVSTSPGPHSVLWGKTVANSNGLAVTIPAADGSGGPVDPPPVDPPEQEHDDEPGTTIQVGPGNVSLGASASESATPDMFLGVPARARQGDVLIAAVAHSNVAPPAVNASWTLLSNVRSGDNRWMAVYGYPVKEQPPWPGVSFSVGDLGGRMTGIMMRLTGVGFDDYKAAAGEWQVTTPNNNRTAFTIPSTGTGSGTMSLVVVYSNTTAGIGMSQATVAGGTLIGHAGASWIGAATTTISAWRASGGAAREITMDPAASNAAGFQISFQPVQPKVPATYEARVMQNRVLRPGTVAAVRQGSRWDKPSMVSWKPKDYTIADLFSTNPFFIAHRGSGDTWPEHTMESYNNSTAYGVKALELSVSLTSDNILICHHDLNFKKTANGDERTIRSMTYQQILDEIRIDTRQWTGLGSTLAPPPLAKDVIDAFIDTHVIFIEDKGGDGANALLNLMDSYPRGKEKFVWKQWAGAGQWQAAKQRGYKLWGYFMSDIFSRMGELAPNFDYLGIPHTASDQVVGDCVALGDALDKPVIMWEIHYRWMFERAKALGIKGMMTSNIPYVMSTSTAQFTEDQWHTGRRPSGDLPHSTDAGWGVQPQVDPANGGVLRYVERANGAMTLGSMCPVPSNDYAVEWEMRYMGPMPTDVSHAGMFFCHDEDRTHRTGAVTPTGGYHVIQRLSGQFDLMRHDPNSGAGIPLSTVNLARPVAGQWMRFRVEVTADGVTARRLDGTATAIYAGDNLYRGGYFGPQKNYTVPADQAPQPLEYRSVKVLPL